jgi:uncharacterized membrane protein YozB (DUF420 family)
MNRAGLVLIRSATGFDTTGREINSKSFIELRVTHKICDDVIMIPLSLLCFIAAVKSIRHRSIHGLAVAIWLT